MLREGLVRPRLADPRAVAVLGVLTAGLSLLPLGVGGVAGTVVQGVVGVALVLLSGHALRLALRPSPPEDTEPTARMERWAWTIALALVGPILGAFLLDVVPGGISRPGWAVLLGVVTVVASGAAWFRGDRPEARLAIRLPESRAVVATIATVVIAGLAITIGVTSAAAVPRPGFTELSLVAAPPPGGTGAPGALPAGGTVVTVHSDEGSGHQYRLQMQTDTGETVGTVALQLAPGESWQQDVGPPVTRAVLYRDPDPSPYRQVWLGRP